MPNITTLKDAETALQPFIPLVAQLTGRDINLKRLRPLMKLLGNPEDKLKVIHIAGTSGKTSTAYYISALLQKSGKKVGLTVSPHVDLITERVQINGRCLDENIYCNLLSDFLEIINEADPRPTYFELLVAFALWVFWKENVDYAVVETGLGGLLDATNIITREDKLCVITDIGFDHTEILGNTLAAITKQKVGIVHNNNSLIMYRQSYEIMDVITQWLKDHHGQLIVSSELEERQKFELDLSSLPTYQQRNWLLAKLCYEVLCKRDQLNKLTDREITQCITIRIPGRMEIYYYKNKKIIMDGAHNKQKMGAFISSFQTIYPSVRPAILIAFKEGKDIESVAELLVPFASRVIITTFKSSQDLPALSVDPEKIAYFMPKKINPKIQIIKDQRLAYTALLKGPEEYCIITGSFYLLSQIRNNEKLYVS